MKKIVTSLIGKKNIIYGRRIFNRSLRSVGLSAGKQSVLPLSRMFSDNNYHVFFGYYDIFPFSYDGSFLLATKIPLIYRTPARDDVMLTGFYDLADPQGKFIETGRTSSWCWQQGCRLQWMPGTDCRSFIYNSINGRHYSAVVKEIATGKTEFEIERPVYSVSPDGRSALSLDFSRLQRLRPGYGYSSLEDLSKGVAEPEDDGIWRLEIPEGRSELLFSVKKIASISRTPDMEGAEHYFNHICFNPSGSKFLFLHLWDRDGRRKSRLIVSNLDGTELKIPGNAFNVSHYTWKSDSEILVTGPSSKGRFEYRLLNLESGSKAVFAEGILVSDGHPSFLPYDNLIITDTYPDKFGERKLILYDFADKSKNEIGSFEEPVRFNGEIRCDLHPRLDREGKRVCIDFIFERNRRAMGIVEIR